MLNTTDQSLLEVLLNSWDRNNTVLLGLLRALPEGGLRARAMQGSPTLAQMLTHVHAVRLYAQGNRKVGTDHSFSWRIKGFNSIQLRCMPMNGVDSPPRHSDD